MKQTSSATRTRAWQVIAWLSLLAGNVAHAAAPIPNPVQVPFTASNWHTVVAALPGLKPDVAFIGHEGFPHGALVLKSGTVALNGLSFRNGTIEFDIKGIGQDIPGIQFRIAGAPGAGNAEEFYIRTFPECRASNDCIQYTPVINGFMLWNAYPQYQTRAFILDGWNHVKLVVSGRRMNVYINRVLAPALAVGNLESSSTGGGIALRGPAVFANLTITPDAVEGLPAQPTPDPSAADRSIVRQWQLGPPTPLRGGAAPAYADMPGPSSGWQPVTAGRFGLVNLNRIYHLSAHPPSLTWLRSTTTASSNGNKHVSLGWLGHAWIFVNGTLVTDGKNFYDPEWERREPDGRLALDNGSFMLPLRKGRNEVVVALFASGHDNPQTPNRYGWGLEMRYDDPRGLSLGK